ncbi:MAG TPA: phosphate/phosphite/phosphonate ABC transporter substrate-binding protein [Burkholderiaceae bacterium]|nr:phosphate/phosphite/phosphonate ABC transporter substrate-binding protein [Burkholderiaceae bacterium]HMX11345.1 phosphate/phosphite/phosphonate ABC transporter substrate-binding protein [Burkholderiaceae bacterium]HMZ00320.1 phosphate/phosphite/phosphonate ABC transporter substrate-binding protein [Burkholderiaceae bacterium]HNB43258.1 phosphate/phosphite/phosphonate ABC transporter substrate-binding protein [Burkholderiaceae bacterium]HNG81010.1 phosphate/phosphite/phosphonate ABC transpor
MTLQLTVSPDFSPDHIAGWYVFNTWLQRQLGVRIHLELYDDFDTQRKAIAADQVDLIYANPYDASMLVREKGFAAVAAPCERPDEAVIAVPAESAVQHVEDLRPGTRVAVTRDPDVNLIGMIMLEPADLKRESVVLQQANSYVLVAKQLLQGKADCGFFLKEAFDDLSGPIRRQLRPLVTSQISVVRHVLMAGPRMREHLPRLTELLLQMHSGAADSGARVLEALGLKAWESQDQEDTEFMIDLMDTLMR